MGGWEGVWKRSSVQVPLPARPPAPQQAYFPWPPIPQALCAAAPPQAYFPWPPRPSVLLPLTGHLLGHVALDSAGKRNGDELGSGTIMHDHAYLDGEGGGASCMTIRT